MGRSTARCGCGENECPPPRHRPRASLACISVGSTPPHSQPRGFPEVWPGLGVSPEDTCVLPASLDSVKRALAGVLAATCPHLAQGLGRNERACRLCCVKNTMGGGGSTLPFHRGS